MTTRKTHLHTEDPDMTNRQRFVNALNFAPADRLPMIEWASWWDETLESWQRQGVPAGLDSQGLFDYWSLDDHRQFWLGAGSNEMQAFKKPGQAGFITDEASYEALLPTLFPDSIIENAVKGLQRIKPQHDRGNFPVWLTLEGFFWWPRTLFGIENYLYSFYDHPALYHRICADLAAWHLKLIEVLFPVLTPDFMTFAEDMSYNHGPMLSESTFNTFLRPYYEKVIPVLKKHGIKVLVDTDGDVTAMAPWLLGAGVEGILPLERQAGVDVCLLRQQFPSLIMVGAFDKTVMKHGEAAMRAEFERLLPVMQSGGFILSVDHQTPPDVTPENYRVYMTLYREYVRR